MPIPSLTPESVNLVDGNNTTGTTVFAPGYLRVALESSQLFQEGFDSATLDTTNRWKPAVSGGGGVAASNTLASTTLGTGTTISGYSYLESQVMFPPTNPGWLYFYAGCNLPSPILINQYFFIGLGTSPGTPTAALPLTNACGFEVATTGKMYAVTYQSGTRQQVADLSIATGNGKQPTDASVHTYYIYYRGDRIFWCIDSQDTVVAQTYNGILGPDVNLLPIKFCAIAGATAPVSSGVLTVDMVTLADTAKNHTQLADSTYPWRQATIDANGALVTKGNYVEQTGLSAATLNADLVPVFDVSSYKWWSLQVTTIATTGTLTFQGSNDGTNFYSIESVNMSAATVGVLTTTTTGLFNGYCGFRYLRIRQTAYGSGSSTGILEMYTSPAQFFPVTAVTASQTGTWTVQPGTTANATPWFTNAVGTTGGTTPYHFVSLATTNATNVKASVGQLYSYVIYNTNASIRFVKLFNKASAPTPGTDTPIMTIPVPPSGQVTADFANGIACALGIGYCTTNLVADLDTTAVGAGDLIINLHYK